MSKPSKPCKVEACSKPRHAQGYCGMHYMRVKAHGTPHTKPRYNNLEDRLKFQIKVHGSGCWEWDGSHTVAGYSVTRVDKTLRYVHRLMYERLHGPLVDELELDHLCRNRGCVNPSHLEQVTHAENMRKASKSYLRQRESIE